MDSMSITPIQTKPMVIKVNGKPLVQPIVLTEEEEEAVKIINQQFSHNFPLFGTVWGAILIREALQKTISLFKEQEEVIPVFLGFEPKDYHSFREIPDVLPKFDFEHIDLFGTATQGINDHLFQPLAQFIQTFLAQFTFYATNLVNSKYVFLVIVLTLCLVLIGRFTKKWEPPQKEKKED